MPSECSSTEPLAVGAYTWLVNHLLKEGGAVVDVSSSSGYATVTALKAGGKALRLSSVYHNANLKHYSQGLQPSYCDKTLEVTIDVTAHSSESTKFNI